MRKILFALVAILAFSCSGGKNSGGFLIKGTISGLKSKSVLLQKYDYSSNQYSTVDSAAVDTTTGKFELKGKVEYPEMLSLILYPGRGRGVSLFVENSKISITGSMDSINKLVIVGSKSNDEFKAFVDQKNALNMKRRALFERYNMAQKAGDKAEMEKINAEYDSLDVTDMNNSKNFVKNNPKSFVAPLVLWMDLSYNLDAKELESYVNGFDTSILKSNLVPLIKSRIDVLKKVEIGQPAPDFTMNDAEGKPVTLSSLYGKYLLIDFWASWCNPCRQENPNVVATYKEYHPKGFNIIGVSFDRDKESWLKAIKDDKLNWTQVSDLQFWNNAAGKLYGIQSIPSNVLLDPKGVIIAKNLRGEDLKNKLKELLK